MANNYTSGTIETNFNEAQQEFFQRHAYARQQCEFGDAPDMKTALQDYDSESDSGYLPDIFDQEGPIFWDMENLDIDAAIAAAHDTFAAFPDSGLWVSINAAWYCSKPRIGEFGGYSEHLEQGVTKTRVVADSKIHMIWQCPDTGEEIAVHPDWYQDNGTPISPETGEDCIYLRTEIEE